MAVALSLLTSIAITLQVPQPPDRAPLSGLVVESVARGSALHRAGIVPGDVLLAWDREPAPPANPDCASGELLTPFDYDEVSLEQAERGPVLLTVRRGSRRLRIRVGAGAWATSIVRPALAGRDLDVYLEGRSLVEKGEVSEGIKRWTALATAWEARRDLGLSGWLHLRISAALIKDGRWEDAARACDVALRAIRRLGSPALEALVWDRKRYVYDQQSVWNPALAAALEARALASMPGPWRLTPVRYDAAIARYLMYRSHEGLSEEVLAHALAVAERLAPGSMLVARLLTELAFVAPDWDDTVALHRRSLAIRERLVPEGLEVADSLGNLTDVAKHIGDLATEERLLRRTLPIHDDLAPGSLAHSASLHQLAGVCQRGGRYAEAEQYLRKAVEMRERIVRGGLDHASALNDLGVLLLERGNLAEAESRDRAALEIFQRLAPGAPGNIFSLTNLGTVLLARGDDVGAEECFRTSLEMSERSGFRMGSAWSLHAIATLAHRRGNTRAAVEAHRHILRELESIGDELGFTAATHVALSEDLALLGDLGGAEAEARAALEVLARGTRATLGEADAWHQLGRVLAARGLERPAEDAFRHALDLREASAPGSLSIAESWREMALLHLRRDPERALGELRRAVAALEAQQGKVGGSDEAQSSLRVSLGVYYRDLIDLLVARGRSEEAFSVLERSRARLLLAMLAERDLVFRDDGELDARRRTLAHEYERIQEELRSGGTPGHQASRLKRLPEIQRERASLVEILRRDSPRLAALHYPEPLGVAAARSALDPGTLLVAFDVGEKETHLFLLAAGNDPAATTLQLRSLPVGKRELERMVEAFRSLIASGEGTSQATREALIARGRELYDLLLAPAEELASRATRLLVLPDGPLHVLPFAALVRGGGGGGPEYVAEWKPIHTAASATVFAELKKTRHPAQERVIVAGFGDPVYGPARGPIQIAQRGALPCPEDDAAAYAAVEPVLGEAVARGFALGPLPASRRELESIASRYAPNTVLYLGEHATEENAKQLGKVPRIIHFACHAILNERSPLDSALALAVPGVAQEGQDNGFLQAWEIFESVRIDADLVTLSACETGLGKHSGGEGLLGLTRAFQYAGARSVLASLWRVEDRPTLELMTRFYTHLRAGATKDEALRLAEVEMIRSKGPGPDGFDLSHPQRWAAFQLVGDWQ